MCIWQFLLSYIPIYILIFLSKRIKSLNYLHIDLFAIITMYCIN